tara:strand:+ start:27 stop:629 length:603 start_codon:yes stop_codon:yes gene_type:complete
MLFNKNIVLASSSKSRSHMLKNNNIGFIRITPKTNEEEIKKQLMKKKISPKTTSLVLAIKKAESISKVKKNSLVVGSDTILVFNKKILNKAKNKTEAKKKLKELSGKRYKIYSSAAAFYKKKLVWKSTQESTIKFRKLSEQEITKYLRQKGKDILLSVGCFQIEKDGPNIVQNIKGDFFNVMGFPLFPFLLFLKKFNMKK